MYLNQVLLWIMITLDGFWHIFVLWLLVFLCILCMILCVCVCVCVCNLGSRGMALSGLCWHFAISSISLFVCLLMLFWCRLYDIEIKYWILNQCDLSIGSSIWETTQEMCMDQFSVHTGCQHDTFPVGTT